MDVAAGTGILSRAIAPFVSQVTAIDISPDMIRQGKIESQQGNLSNIEFVEGVVEELPFKDDSFDIVVSRFAFHHFVEPMKVFSEMNRVCRKGIIAVIDIISPTDTELNKKYNRYEKLRDPSHTKALTRVNLLVFMINSTLTY